MLARSSTVVHSLAVRLAKPQPLLALLLANTGTLACRGVVKRSRTAMLAWLSTKVHLVTAVLD